MGVLEVLGVLGVVGGLESPCKTPTIWLVFNMLGVAQLLGLLGLRGALGLLGVMQFGIVWTKH